VKTEEKKVEKIKKKRKARQPKRENFDFS